MQALPSVRPIYKGTGCFCLKAPYPTGCTFHAGCALQSLLNSRRWVIASSLLSPCPRAGNEIECEQIMWSDEPPPNPNTSSSPSAFSTSPLKPSPALPPDLLSMQQHLPSAPLSSVPFSSYLWRRGTVPIWWGAEIKSTLQDAELFVLDSQPDGTLPYFDRLVRRYAQLMRGGEGGSGGERKGAQGIGSGGSSSGGSMRSSSDVSSAAQRSRAVFDLLSEADAPSSAFTSPASSGFLSARLSEPAPAEAGSSSTTARFNSTADVTGPAQPQAAGGLLPLVCINLLRLAQGKPEFLLSEKFQEAVGRARAHPRLSGFSVEVLSYDWHGMSKAVGEAGMVEGLWARLRAHLPAIGCSVGCFFRDGSSEGDTSAVAPSTARMPGGSEQGDGRVRRDGPTVDCDADSDGASGMQGVIPNRGVERGFFRLQQRQAGVMRLNCADSLDRTNAASFFSAVQVLLEQARLLGLQLRAPQGGGATAVEDEREEGASVSEEALLAALPAGWEMRRDPKSGRVFYIDHSAQKTQWSHPCPPPPPSRPPPPPPIPTTPWDTLSLTTRVFQEAALPAAVTALAELFALAGDTHASLYTGSRAMHSHVLQLLSQPAEEVPRPSSRWGASGIMGGSASASNVTCGPSGGTAAGGGGGVAAAAAGGLGFNTGMSHSSSSGSLSGIGGGGGGNSSAATTASASAAAVAANFSITLQRRVANLLWDASRQRQLELLLGLRRHRVVPLRPERPLVVASGGPGALLLRPVPSLFPNLSPGSALLQEQGKGFVWAAPLSTPFVELLLFLPSPCHVSHLVLTVAHGANDLASPVAFDVRVGRTIDDLRLVMEVGGWWRGV